jgi:hypothetical protein
MQPTFLKHAFLQGFYDAADNKDAPPTGMPPGRIPAWRAGHDYFFKFVTTEADRLQNLMTSGSEEFPAF